jgi:leucyl aminopeptidase (aminopeptidase T)
MKSGNVTIAITTYSLTHTDARVNTCKVGGRVASMPMFVAEMFYRGGPMASDYREIDKETKKIAEWITKASEGKVSSPGGTDIIFSLKGRNGMTISKC